MRTSRARSVAPGFCAQRPAVCQADSISARVTSGADCQRSHMLIPLISRLAHATTCRPEPASVTLWRTSRNDRPSHSKFCFAGWSVRLSRSDVHCVKPACKTNSSSEICWVRCCARAIPSTPLQLKPAMMAIRAMATSNSMSVKPPDSWRWGSFISIIVVRCSSCEGTLGDSRRLYSAPETRSRSFFVSPRVALFSSLFRYELLVVLVALRGLP